MKPEIKICGITCEADIALLNEFPVDYAGFVLFYPKSRRYLGAERAAALMKRLRPDIKKTAVLVSPDAGQLSRIRELGFDLAQIHGPVSEELLATSPLPVFRAFAAGEFAEQKRELPDTVIGLVFDGKTPGGGETFDWSALSGIFAGGRRIMLAGGLNALNVREAVWTVRPDIVDVSTGVEKKDGTGKDREKLRAFVQAARGGGIGGFDGEILR